MIKTKETTIHGTNFKVTQLGFGDGADLLISLGKTIGPSLAKFSHSENSVTMALGEIATKLSASDLNNAVSKLANRTLIEREPGSGKWPKFDPEIDLAGRYDLMFRWLGFALEVNYGDFFAEGGLLSGLVEGAGLNHPAA